MIARHPCIRYLDAKPHVGGDEIDVIRSFGDQRTGEVFHGHTTREVRRLDVALVKATARKLDMIVAAQLFRIFVHHPAIGWKRSTVIWKGGSASA